MHAYLLDLTRESVVHQYRRGKVKRRRLHRDVAEGPRAGREACSPGPLASSASRAARYFSYFGQAAGRPDGGVWGPGLERFEREGEMASSCLHQVRLRVIAPVISLIATLPGQLWPVPLASAAARPSPGRAISSDPDFAAG